MGFGNNVKRIFNLSHAGPPGRFRPAPPGLMAPPAYHGSTSTYFHQPTAQYPFPYSAYG